MASKAKCEAVKADGTPCKAWAVEDEKYCRAHLGQADRVDNSPEPEGPDFSGGLCPAHFPLGWPEDATGAGCADGSFHREVTVDDTADNS